MEMCYFGLITRVVGRLRSINYERASPLSKTLLEAATHIDHFLIETLGIRGLASVAVVYSAAKR